MTRPSRTEGLLRLLSIADVADILGCCEKTVRRRIDSGDLPVIRDGRMVRVHPAEFERYLKLRRSE